MPVNYNLNMHACLYPIGRSTWVGRVSHGHVCHLVAWESRDRERTGEFILASGPVLMSRRDGEDRYSRSEIELLIPRMTGQCGVDICGGADRRIDEES